MIALVRHLLLATLALAGVVLAPDPAGAGPGSEPRVTIGHAHAADAFGASGPELAAEPAHEDDQEDEDQAAHDGPRARGDAARAWTLLREDATVASGRERRDGLRVRGPPRPGGAA